MDASASHFLAERAPGLLPHFGIEPQRVLPLPSWNNPVVRIETSHGTFALRWRKQPKRSEAQIRAELTLLHSLEGSSLRVPQPLPTRAGDFLLVVDGHGYDLSCWLPGSVRRRDLEQHHAHALGLTLAELHQAMKIRNLPRTLPRYLEPFSVKGARNLAVLATYFGDEDLALFRSIERQAGRMFAQWARQPDSVGAIHNDFILGNCLWQGDRVSIIDFADCGAGLYLYDLAPMLTNLDSPDLQNAFIEGYTSVRPLSETELESLPLLQGVRHVRVCLSSVAKAQRGESGPPLAQHLASRMRDIRTLRLS